MLDEVSGCTGTDYCISHTMEQSVLRRRSVFANSTIAAALFMLNFGTNNCSSRIQCLSDRLG
jgi:hypothetical protein